MLHISTVKWLSSNLYGFIQHISTSFAKIVKHCLIWETDGLHNHVIKNLINPKLRHIYNADRPLLMSEDIRSVTVRDFPVSIIFIGNSRDLVRFFWKY